MLSKTTRIFLLAAAIMVLGASCFAAGTVAHQRLKIGKIWVNVVTADLNSPRVRVTPAISRHGIGHSESFRSMLRRTRPAAAIDGTFFCTRSLKPTGDIVIDGQLVYRGYLGMAVGFRGNSVRFVPCDSYDWTDYDSVLVAGPSLLLNGKVAVYPKDQGFRSGVHFSKRIRAAVGVTSKNKLILITTLRNVYLSQLARIMKTLGCVDAAGLDGGSSTGLYCNGKLISNPSRGMTNCLLIYDDLQSYESHRGSFYPTQQYTKRPSNSSQPG